MSAKLGKRILTGLVASATLLLYLTLPASAQTVEVGPPVKIIFPEPPPRVIAKPLPPGSPAPQNSLSKWKGETDPKIVSLSIPTALLSQTSASPGETVTGKFTLFNNSSFKVYGIRYGVFIAEKNRFERPIYLSSDDALLFMPLPSYIHTVDGGSWKEDKITLQPQETAVKDISFTVPASLPKGEYFVWVRAQSERGNPFFSKELALPVIQTATSSPKISFSNFAFVFKNPEGKDEYDNGNAILFFQPNEAIKILFQIVHPFRDGLSLTPRIDFRKYSEVGPEAQRLDLPERLIEKGPHSLTLTFPTPTVPGKYTAIISFSGKFKDQPIPPSYFPVSHFEFIVPGDQAVIQNIIPGEGQGANKIFIRTEGSPLPNVILGEVELRLTVTDLARGKVVASESQQFSLTGATGEHPIVESAFTLSAPPPAYPHYEASLVKGEKILDTFIFEPNGKAPPGSAESKSSLQTILLIGIFIVLGGALLWWKTRRKEIPMALFIVAAAFFFSFLFAPSAKADYWNCLDCGHVTPVPGQIINPGQPVTFSGNTQAYVSAGPRTGSNCCNHGGISGSAIVVWSDTEISNSVANTLTAFDLNAINTAFAGTNYKLYSFPLTGDIGCLKSCVAWWLFGFNGQRNAPTDNAFIDRTSYVYTIFSSNHGSFLLHVPVTITSLSYSLSASPGTRTVAIGQKASYEVSILPDHTDFAAIPNDYFLDKPLGYVLGDNFNGQNPVGNSGYKPGDEITFSLGAQSARTGVGTNECSRISGYGGSLAMVVLSDQPPKDATKLTINNIGEQFENRNYRSLGVLNSSLQLGYNGNCTVWFTASISGKKRAPGAGAVCTAAGALNPYNGKVLAYVIFSSDIGSFVAHQEIRIGPSETLTPPRVQSVFTAPVNLSLFGSLTKCINNADMTCAGAALDPKAYTIEFAPSLTANADPVSNTYAPVTMKITPQKYTETTSFYGCPGSCPIPDIWGAGYCTTDGVSYCGAMDFQTQTIEKLPAPGKYKFKIQGVSGGNLPGITKITPDPFIEITATPPPTPFDNLHLNGLAVCKSVPLAWDATNFSTVSGPIAWWKMDEQPGNNTVADSAGTHNGTANAGATVLVPGKIGNARNFNNGKVDVGSIDSGPQGTMEAWIKPNGNYGGSQFIAGSVVSPDSTFSYTFFANHPPACGGRWGAIINEGSYRYVCSNQTYDSTNFPQDTWTHLAVVYDNATVKFYKDGDPAGIVAKGAGGTVSPTAFTIGDFAHSPGIGYKGGIDDVRLYDRALSAAEIKYQIGTGPSPNEYRMYRLRPVGTGLWVDISGRINPALTTFTDDAMSNPADPPKENNFYVYKVAASNANGSTDSNVLPIRTFTCPTLPDLIVSAGPALNSGALQAGNSVTFKATIKNDGGKEAKSTDGTPFNNRFYVDVGNDNVGPFTDITPFPTINSLNVDGTQEVTSENWTNIPQGTHRIVVCADEPSPKVDESNELNNCSPTSGSTGVITVAAPKPDLVISSGPSLNSGTLVAGQTVTFKATVRNINPIAAGAFRTQFKVDINNDGPGGSNPTLAPNPSLAGLAASGGEDQVVSGTWVNIPVGTHRVEVCADRPNNAVDESDESDASNCNAPGTGVIVVVNPPPPTITLTASPNPVGKNNPTTLTWDATDVNPADPTPCTASSLPVGVWSGDKAASGSGPSGNLTQTTKFTLTCDGPGGTNSANKTVLVGVIEEPPPGF